MGAAAEPVVSWSLTEARRHLAGGDLDRTVGAAHGISAVIVAIDAGDDGADVADALRRLPVVAIGHGDTDPPNGSWDLVTPDPTPYRAGIQQNPHAAVVAAEVLRVVPTLDPHDALRVESAAYAVLQRGTEHQRWLERRGRRVRTDDAPRVRIEDGPDGAAVITLQRPRLRNLLDARMRDELVEVLRALHHDPERPIRLRGDGPAFCAGGDLAEFGTATDPPTAHLIRGSANVAPWLLAAAPRTTAHVHGACVGAGVELAAFCHRVVAAVDTEFRLPELAMGLLPGAGGTVSISRRIGPHRTLGWLLSDATIDAPTALAWGLVDELA